MARIRTIKPQLLRHMELYKAEKKHKFPLRVAFIGLILCADRDGKFKWEPEALKLDCLPYDAINFEKVMDALVAEGFIIKYEVKGRTYGLLPTFKDHQRIRNDEAKSTIPDYYPSRTRHEPVTNPQQPVTNQHRGREGNMEGKGKEGSSADAPETLYQSEQQAEKKEPPGSAPPPLDEIVMPFTSDEFSNLWQKWKDYRKKEFRKSYKTPESEQAALSHLVNICEGREDNANEIIKQSMGNQWQGLFELKNNAKNGQRQGATGAAATGLNGDYKRKLAERMAGNGGAGEQYAV